MINIKKGVASLTIITNILKFLFGFMLPDNPFVLSKDKAIKIR